MSSTIIFQKSATMFKKNTFKESRHLSKNYPLENDKIESMKASFEIKIESHF